MAKIRDYQVYEILEEVQALETDIARVARLKEFQEHTPLQYVLKWNFCDTLKSLVPEGSPPYESAEDGPSPASLWGYLKVFPKFVDCPEGRALPALRRESLFIEMLQAVDKDEAELLIAVKDKKYDGLNVSVIMEAFPGLIAESSQPVHEKTDAEKAEEMKLYAEQLVNQAKELNNQAKELKKEASQLLKSEA